MPEVEVMEFDVFYDYLCPFVYRATVLLRNVRASGERSLKVGWRYFSLTQVNSRDEGWTVWEAPAGDKVKGRLAFKGAEAARRQGRFDDFHLPMLLARHRDRLDIDQVDVVERVAVDAGLDLDRFRTDVADPHILDALAKDHMQAVAVLGVFGTPTFVFRGGVSAYVRLSEPTEPADALRVFDALVEVAAREPGILEIKRPHKPSPD